MKGAQKQILLNTHFVVGFKSKIMKKEIETVYIRLVFVIGLGYWKDVYEKEKTGLKGEIYNLILPFVRIHWGYLEK